MTLIEITLLLLVGYTGFWVLKVRQASIDPISALKQFGPPADPFRPLTKEEREALFHAAVRQQKTAFGVLVLAITLGVLLGAALLGRIVFAPSLDLDLLGRAAVLLGDLALCQYASRLNKDATARVTSVVKMITKL
jgi:hypothetical protein